MKEGDVVLTPLPQADGSIKNRPALLLRQLPPFGDFLVCGISTQVRLMVPGFDDVLSQSAPDFMISGLVAESVIRLGFLAVMPVSTIPGRIGSVSGERHARLLRRLAEYLMKGL
jgi:mRNA interferase MazF